MVKLSSFKLHKFAGLTAGTVLFILAISGFVLDHDYWRVFYSLRFEIDSPLILQKEQRLITSKIVLKNHTIVGSMRGVYESQGKTNYIETLDLPTMALFSHHKNIYAATTEGIYLKHMGKWQLFALEGEVVTALSGNEEKLVAVIDKKELVTVDYNGKVLQRNSVAIDKEQLSHSNVTLSRFLRDLHYGRGIFDEGLSLLLNDYAAFVLSFLALSGYVIWFLIWKKRAIKWTRFLIRAHANSFVIVASFILIVLGISGIYLDHASFFGKFSKKVYIPHTFLPPIYHSLKEDVWSVALFDNNYYIGNRVGVYRSKNMKNWELVSSGFGYSLGYVNEHLFIGGMGAPNRVCDTKECKTIFDAPHMFKQVYMQNDKIHYLAPHTKSDSLPHFQNITLYTLMLSLHDGSFFASWWIWINDVASLLLFVLIGTGSYRWWKKRAVRVKKG